MGKMTSTNHPRAIRAKVYECEHRGDLAEYTQVLERCGAKVTFSKVLPDQEIGIFEFSIDDLSTFKEKMRQEPSVDLFVFSH